MGKHVIRLGNMNIEFHFPHKESITVFEILQFRCSIRSLLSIENENGLNLKRDHKSSIEKVNLSLNKF